MRLAALLTCHNRREQTLVCLRALRACTLPAGCDLAVYLVDDGSRDGRLAVVSRDLTRTVPADAARTLQEEFLAVAGAEAMILPAIRPIAEGQEDLGLIAAAGAMPGA